MKNTKAFIKAGQIVDEFERRCPSALAADERHVLICEIAVYIDWFAEAAVKMVMEERKKQAIKEMHEEIIGKLLE